MIEVFNHTGFGVSDIERSTRFYSKTLGFSVKVDEFEDDYKNIVGDDAAGESAREFLRSTPYVPERIKVRMFINPLGGAMIEMAQPISQPAHPHGEQRWGDIGFLGMGAKAYRLDDLLPALERKGVGPVTPVTAVKAANGSTWRSAFLRDPDGTPVELLETPEPPHYRKPAVGGLSHLLIGVSDMDRSVDFYSRALGFDVVAFDSEGAAPALDPSDGESRARTVVLERSRRPGNTLPREPGMVRLVQATSFEGKHFQEGIFWGGTGILELGLEVTDIDGTYSRVLEAGAEPFIGPTGMRLSRGTLGRFAYTRDPDGNLVELTQMDRTWFLPPGLMAFMNSLMVKVRLLR
ncbi:MAG: VOC family protein [Actinobacteria bacterium]|nr:VOC family protein [Actinomycetota bacterium]MBU1944990.1 VOC family protein [Actinomycetota bacterium]MBU2688471.1 VOC family protein [Actinomycetota bacterium]